MHRESPDVVDWALIGVDTVQICKNDVWNTCALQVSVQCFYVSYLHVWSLSTPISSQSKSGNAQKQVTVVRKEKCSGHMTLMLLAGTIN